MRQGSGSWRGAISKSLMMRMVLQIDPEGWMELGKLRWEWAGMAESHMNKESKFGI